VTHRRAPGTLATPDFGNDFHGHGEIAESIYGNGARLDGTVTVSSAGRSAT
jgi:hypothetical protein